MQWPNEKRTKRISNDPQYFTQKTKDRAIRTPLKTGSEHRCSEVSTGGACPVSVANLFSLHTLIYMEIFSSVNIILQM